MKKILASILPLIYFTVSTGFTVNLHYCMDTFQSWEFGDVENEQCDQCGMNTSKSSGCCRDEVKVLKLQQDVFEFKAIAYQIELPLLIGNDLSSYLLLPFQNSLEKGQNYSHSPPLLNKQNTYLDNCVFRI